MYNTHEGQLCWLGMAQNTDYKHKTVRNNGICQ